MLYTSIRGTRLSAGLKPAAHSSINLVVSVQIQLLFRGSALPLRGLRVLVKGPGVQRVCVFWLKGAASKIYITSY